MVENNVLLPVFKSIENTLSKLLSTTYKVESFTEDILIAEKVGPDPFELPDKTVLFPVEISTLKTA